MSYLNIVIFLCIMDSYMIIYIFKEKWDSMTRKWKDNCLLQLVRLFLIDEVSVFVTYFAHKTVFGCYFLPLYFPAQWEMHWLLCVL